MKKLLLAIALVVVPLLLFSEDTEAAYTYNNFPHNNIIDNEVFRNTSTMNTAQIQSFLNARGGQLASRSFSGQTAAQIIYQYAQAYGINPQVIIATLQKEQSLITDPSPHSSQYDSAMGYFCPTGDNGCNETYGGFKKQVDHGTWQLRFNYERANGNNAWWNPNTPYACIYTPDKEYYNNSLLAGRKVGFRNSKNSAPYRTITIANAATASLYCYTPHLYSPYWSGSYNFLVSFENWFGSTRAKPCVRPNDESGGIYRLVNPNTNNYFLTSSPNEICTVTRSMGYKYDGILFYPAGTGSAPIYRLVKNGNYLYTASQSERNSAINNGFRLDGTAFTGSTSYNASTSPHPVYRLNYPPTGGYFYTISSIEANEAVSKMGYKMEGIVFYTKNTTGQSYPHDVYRLAHSKSGYLFTASSSERTNAIQKYGFRDEGVGFQTRVGYTTDNLPVYRMASNKGYLFTTSLSERKRAIRLGYRPEGIAYFAYPTSNLGASKQVYRLAHRNGVYLYTVHAAERDSAVSKYGYRYEGVVFRIP